MRRPTAVVQLVGVDALLATGHLAEPGHQPERWVYLGKSVSLRQRVERLAGATPRHSLGDTLQRVAAEVRQPFLDFVAEVGATESDPVAWWSTTFSWKVWGASDLFLLVCYLRMGIELGKAALAGGGRLVLVVEDPWLLAQLAEHWSGSPQVQCTGQRSLMVERARALAFGVARRLAWLWQTMTSWARQRWWSRGRMTAAGATAGIYSFPMERCLRDGNGWADALLPGMDELLRGLGHRVAFFSTPERSGFERALGARREYFLPLILCCTPGLVVRSLLAMWRPRRRSWPAVAGLRVDFLARREFWRDAARAAWCRNRLFFECARRMMRDGAWEWVVFPFENQPWEKLLVLAARERGVRTAGVQHSTLARNYLSYFLGHGETSRMPLPDAVLTAGTYAQETLSESGYPSGCVRLVGSMRYRHLVDASPAVGGIAPPPRSAVLVGLPIDRPMAEHLLAALAAAFPDGGRADGLGFFVKAHPMTPVTPQAFGLTATTIAGTFEEAIGRCGTVVYIGSTTGPEAAAYGRTVLRYYSDVLLDVDVSEPLRGTIPSCGDHDLRPALLDVVAHGQMAAAAGLDAPLARLFSPVDGNALGQLFSRQPATPGAPRLPKQGTK